MGRTKIIGLCGYTNSGKDTVATILDQTGRFTPFAFSDPMYKILAEVMDVPWDYLHETKRDSAEIRRRLQVIGQMSREHISNDVWVQAAQKRYFSNRMHCPDLVQVVTDVRYPNEESWLRANGGELWWVDREGCGPVNDHKSESHYTWLREVSDMTIVNNGSIEDLQRVVQQASLRY